MRSRSIGNSPKVIIVSGSNALFGMDSELLGGLLGRPVVNMASHASLPLDFHAEKVLSVASAGDAVVMPLEFGYYAAEPTPTAWEVANLSSWGVDYAKRSSDRLWMYFRYSAVSESIYRFIFRPIPHDPISTVLARATANSARGVVRWEGYSYKSANAWGEFLVKEGGGSFVGPAPYTRGALTPFAIERLTALRDALAEKGATLRLTWPVTARNDQFDLSIPEHAVIVAALRDKLAAAGLSVICEPSDFHFERRLFLNTNYHLGAEGAVYRTEALATCLLGRKPPADIVVDRLKLILQK